MQKRIRQSIAFIKNIYHMILTTTIIKISFFKAKFDICTVNSILIVNHVHFARSVQHEVG